MGQHATDDRFRSNRSHWDRVIDPQNLSESARPVSLERELRHWDTTEQRWALDRMEPLRGARVMELGGGLGVGALALARRGARVVLLDVSLPRARAAREALRRAGVGESVDIVVAAAEALPFIAESFDRITTKSVLIHTDLPRAASEVHRILKIGGHAVLLEPLDAHPAILLYRAVLAPKSWRQITTYFNRRQVATLAVPFQRRKAAVRLRCFHLFGVLSAFFAYGPLRCRPLRRLCESIFDPFDAWLFRRFPGLRWRAWFAAIDITRRPPV